MVRGYPLVSGPRSFPWGGGVPPGLWFQGLSSERVPWRGPGDRGIPPPPRQDQDRDTSPSPRKDIPRMGYAVGGTPPSVTQDFLVSEESHT